MRDRINFNSTNDEVISVLRREINQAVDRSFQILRNRIDRFGVAQPNIQKLAGSNRILVELPGVKEPERVRRLLQGTARLEFWETFEYSEVHNYFAEANEMLRGTVVAEESQDEIATETQEQVTEELEALDLETPEEEVDSLRALLETEALETDDISREDFIKQNPLFAYLQPAIYNDGGQAVFGRGPTVGFAALQDTARVNKMLKTATERGVFPRNLRLHWNFKPNNDDGLLGLVAIKVTTREGIAPLSGDAIVNARQDFDPTTGNVEVTMQMNSEGANIWRRLTADNVNRSIAIVLDDFVYSAPNVLTEIAGGRSQITGNFTVEEGQDLANILRAGSLPAPARIVEEAIVGPSLGREAINAGFISFILAFVLLLIFMPLYYSKAGLVANLVLVANVFFLFGVLASLGAVLTLPGIAGIVLTLGMAVDANVIIFERIREELRAGKGLKLAISDGYKNAYSAIIDGNVTTLLTGIVLYVFGSGPVQGFATTLIIGIISSLFTAIFLSRLIFNYWLENNKPIPFNTKLSQNILANVNIDFLALSKKAFTISTVVIVIGIAAIVIRGFSFGVDFSGGRSYVVRFDQEVSTADMRISLTQDLGETAEVKTFGPSNQVKIITRFMIDDTTEEADITAERRVYESILPYFRTPISFEEFISDDDKVLGRLSSQKVGPTVARDIKVGAVISVILAMLIIFAYIALRFKKWQFGAGGLAALFHDSFLVISLFALLHKIAPWTMEIDQAFIAAILTIIGYSINDSVIIFDRIRENFGLYPKRDIEVNINNALNSTLARTLITSGTTFAVLLTIFLFGGEVIRGFAFSLLIGVAVGTYSSLFIATPIAHKLLTKNQKKGK
jgi:SecD/SecF fusion protein